MSGPNDLYRCARELLVACEEAVALGPGGEILRSFISNGPPAWDAYPQLTVHATGPSMGDTAPLQPPLQPLHRIDGTGHVPIVSLIVTVLRGSPVPQQYEGEVAVVPDPARIDESAKIVLGDIWSIWNHLVNLKRAGRLWPDRCREMILDPAIPLDPSGGIAGWALPVRVALYGYEEVLP